MTEETISEIGVDDDGRLFVRPSRSSFDHIHRAAMEVNWDPSKHRLFSPKPREWSHARWFAQILAAAADEYGVRLRLSADTEWTDVPDLARAEIEAGR